MALNVKFLKGTSEQYNASTKTATTFYFVDDSDLYLGNIKLSNATDLASAVSRIATNESEITKINESLKALIGGESGSVSDLITKSTKALEDKLQPQITTNKNAIDAINNVTTGILAKAKKYADDQDTAKIGDLSTLTTEAKETVVAAINEVDANVDTLKTDSTVKITTDVTTEGMAKSYTVTQGTTKLGVIDIPKDMVVESGKVVVDPEGQEKGTYIELTLANKDSDKLYINVGTLVDIYTTAQGATQVQLAIDPKSREISATIVAGSITDAELAANAVTTAKIKDGNVTLTKLATAVQTSLGKADSALQAGDVVTGTANGTVSVKGTTVAVKGLGGAAYKEANAFDAAGSATTAETNAKSYTDTALTWNSIA